MTLDEQRKKLAYLLTRMPERAVSFRVVTGSLGGGQTICEYEREEIRDNHEEVATRVVASCDSWVSSSERWFYGQWLSDSGRILDNFRWRMNPENGSDGMAVNNWDGSPEQLIQHLVAKSSEKDRIFIELLRTAFEFSQSQMQSIMERNMYLEKQRLDTDKIREELIRMEAEITAGHEDSQNFNRLTDLAEKVLTANIERKVNG